MFLAQSKSRCLAKEKRAGELPAFDAEDIQYEAIITDADRHLKIPGITEREDLERMHEPNKTKVIIDLLRNDKQEVFDYLYEHERPRIIRLAIKNSGNNVRGEDLFQDVLLIVYEKIKTTNLQIECAFSTYLYSVARLLWMNELRKKHSQVKLVESYEHLKIDLILQDDLPLPEQYEALHEAIQKLGEACRKLLLYFYFYRYPWDEISKLLGYSSAASARNQKYQCLERIREQVVK